MHLAKLEIIKSKLNEVITEKAILTAFNKDGSPFMKADLNYFGKEYDVISSFNHHGDTYLLIADK